MNLSRTLTGARIAIIEDDTLLRESLALFLRARGCQVKAFESAEDACRTGNLGDYDAVISDYLLPGENGISLLRRARKASKHPVTILITAYAKADLAEEMRRAGIDAFIPKPFSAEELESALQRLIDRGDAVNNGLSKADV
ncbi:MAG: response regulator [Deltaproteobacteria bacterium]|nr:response regulator [Deltaproteobacteria bacterium]